MNKYMIYLAKICINKIRAQFPFSIQLTVVHRRAKGDLMGLTKPSTFFPLVSQNLILVFVPLIMTYFIIHG